MGVMVLCQRIHICIALLITVPVSFGLKYYPGPGRWWLNNWGASLGYEVFFILLGLLIVARLRAVNTIALSVCLATVALEFMQWMCQEL